METRRVCGAVLAHIERRTAFTERVSDSSIASTPNKAAGAAPSAVESKSNVKPPTGPVAGRMTVVATLCARSYHARCPICKTVNFAEFDGEGRLVWWPNSFMGAFCSHSRGFYADAGRSGVIMLVHP